MNPPSSAPPPAPPDGDAPQLARRLGLFDATMIVMGGIVGSGIFVTPYAPSSTWTPSPPAAAPSWTPTPPP